MADRFNPHWIVGKTVARVEMNQFPSELHRGQRPDHVAHNPRIYFADGSSIAFMTQETETGEYGTNIIYSPASKRHKKHPAAV